MLRAIPFALALVPASALAQSLTLVAPNNGHNMGSIFFDLTSTTDITVTQLDYFVRSAAAGTPLPVDLYVRSGSYVGFDTEPTAWTLHDSGTVISNGNNTLATYELNTGLVLPAGQTIGVYFIPQGGLQYNSSGPDQQGNVDLTLFGNLVRTAPWGGSTFTPRTLSGTIHYIHSGSVCYANCDASTTPPILNVDDFTCFINEFASAQSLPHEQQLTHYANCDDSSVAPVLNVDDFTCFINAFAAGCP